MGKYNVRAENAGMFENVRSFQATMLGTSHLTLLALVNVTYLLGVNLIAVCFEVPGDPTREHCLRPLISPGEPMSALHGVSCPEA